MKKSIMIFAILLGLIVLPVASQNAFETQGRTNSIALESFSQMTFRNNLALSDARSGGSLAAYYESVLGSPYIYDAMLPAKVNNFKDVIGARYDAFKDLITIQMSKTKNFFLEKKLGNKVKFIKTNEEYRVFYGEKEKASFFKVIKYSEKYSLLIKEQVKLTGGEKPKSTYDEYKAPAFKRAKDKLYLSLDNENAIKVPTNKKKFYKLFTSKEIAIKSFVKKNKLDIKNRKDILKVLAHFTSL